MVCCCTCIVVIGLTLWLIKWFLERLTITEYRKKTVFVTGCDSGFGTGIALKLLANGMPVYAGCLTEKGQENLRYCARHLPGKLTTMQLDVTDQESVDRARELIEKEVGNKGLYALVNNAGILGAAAPDDWLTVAHYQQVLDVNTLGVIRVTHAFKRLIKQAKGRVVTACSVAGRLPFPLAPPYCASKFATEAYCDVLRHEMRSFGVGVHILEPGFFATEILNVKYIQERFSKVWEQTSAETKEEYGQAFFEHMRDDIPNHLLKRASKDIYMVTDAYFHAITAMFPRLRYWVGSDATFMFIPLTLVPTVVQDFILYTVARKLHHVPLPQAAVKN